MGNSSQKQTNKLLDTQRDRIGSSYEPIGREFESRSRSAYDESRNLYPGLRDTFQRYLDTGGFNESEFDPLRRAAGGGGGGSSVASELAKTGGIDSSVFSTALRGYEEFAGGGGVDADSIRARSNRAIPQFYRNLQNEASRRRLVNPYAPTYNSEQRSLARQAGQQTQENIRDTELGISQLISDNRKFGITGSGNLNAAIQQMIQSGRISGGNQEIANAELGDRAAARRLGVESDILGMKVRGRELGLGGLSDLYGANRDEAANYLDRYLATIGARNEGELATITGRREETPWWEKLISPIAGATGAYFGGRDTRRGASA